MPKALASSLLDTPQTAKILDVAESTVAKMRMTGEGPVFIKIGASVRYAPADLDDWLAALRRRSTSETADAV